MLGLGRMEISVWFGELTGITLQVRLFVNWILVVEGERLAMRIKIRDSK